MVTIKETSDAVNSEIGVLGVWSDVLMPKGTRFGPVVGKIITPAEIRDDMDKKYFWKIFNKSLGTVSFIRDGKDVSVSNWMRYVLPANGSNQNLVAYQV